MKYNNRKPAYKSFKKSWLQLFHKQNNKADVESEGNISFFIIGKVFLKRHTVYHVTYFFFKNQVEDSK